MNEQIYYTVETEWGLHVTNTENCLDNYETVTANMKAIIETAVAKGISRILCESHKMKTMMSVIELYQLANNLAKWETLGMRIAYLMPKLVEAEDAIFFETVTSNRAVTIKFFADYDKAVAWLCEGSLSNGNKKRQTE